MFDGEQTQCSWILEKYARFVSELSACPTNESNGHWEYHNRKVDSVHQLQLCIKEPNNILISVGSKVLESFSLLGAEDWLRLICKGDSMLFLYKWQDKTRRFRIKFASGELANGTENCLAFVKVISKYVQVKILQQNNEEQMEIDTNHSSLDQENSQSNSFCSMLQIPKTNNQLMPLKTTTEKILGNETRGMGQFYEVTNIPTTDLSQLVKTCLLDQNFPAFVDVVEHALKEITDKYD